MLLRILYYKTEEVEKLHKIYLQYRVPLPIISKAMSWWQTFDLI